jgi:hypothetical protein
MRQQAGKLTFSQSESLLSQGSYDFASMVMTKSVEHFQR